MKMGDYVVYIGSKNKPKLGKWVTITKNHRAVIRCIQPGNDAMVIRGMNSIVPVQDFVDKVASLENKKKVY